MKRKYFSYVLVFLLPVIILASGDPVVGKGGMAATANPYATDIAVKILQNGGNAIDAAVAASFMLGVVEPDASGLGGGGGMLIYIKAEDKFYYLNFYPKSGSKEEVKQYRSLGSKNDQNVVCVPGQVDGLITAVEKFGSKPLAELILPSAEMAENGFPLDNIVAQIILDNFELVSKYPSSAEIYFNEGFPRMEGELLIQGDLAKTLRQIASGGRSAFYESVIADHIITEVNSRGGYLTKDDFRNFQTEISNPLISDYRGNKIISADIPQSGAFIIESLNILENFDIPALGSPVKSAKSFHLIAETLKRMYTDRSEFLGDPNFSDIPVEGIISKPYGRSRSLMINPEKMSPENYKDTETGNPFEYLQDSEASELSTDENSSMAYLEYLNSPDYSGGHTSHLSVIDKDGNIVSLTQTLGTFFGSGLTVDGVLLNSIMTNFSRSYKPNIIDKAKQPASAISPTIILTKNNGAIAIGSPGAGRIVSAIIEVTLNILDFGMNIQEANDAPRFYCRKNEEFIHAENRFTEDIYNTLKAMGHNIQLYPEYDKFFGGVHIVELDMNSNTFFGSADPRRGGTAKAVE